MLRAERPRMQSESTDSDRAPQLSRDAPRRGAPAPNALLRALGLAQLAHPGVQIRRTPTAGPPAGGRALMLGASTS